MDHMVKSERRSLLVRLHARSRPGRFASAQLESLYRDHYRRPMQRRALLELHWVFAIMCLALAAIATITARSATIAGIVSGALCAAFVLQLAAMTIRQQPMVMTHRLVMIITTQLLIVYIVCCSLPINIARQLGINTIDSVQLVSAADGVASMIVVLFTVYTLLPIETVWAVGFGVTASLAHLIAGAIFAEVYRDAIGQQLAANTIVFLWTNSVGLYVHCVCANVIRATFLETRNCIAACQDIDNENDRLERLLSTALPHHVVDAIRGDLNGTTGGNKTDGVRRSIDNLYVEQYDNVSILSSHIAGLETIVTQCSAQDAVRSINELMLKIDLLTLKHGCIRVPSIGNHLLIACGVPGWVADHAKLSIHLANDLIALVRSFSEATGTNLFLRCAIDSGSIVAGVVGIKKWHYDIIGKTVENAIELRQSAAAIPNKVLISSTTMAAVQHDEQLRFEPAPVDDSSRTGAYYVVGTSFKPPDASLIFDGTSNKRLSFTTVSISINRLLQSLTPKQHVTTTDTVLTINGTNTMNMGRRKRRSTLLTDDKTTTVGVNAHLMQTIIAGNIDRQHSSSINCFSLQFDDNIIEQKYNEQFDRWFIPAVAISVLFLVFYGIYHLFVLPQLISTLLVIIASLASMSIILLLLYVSHFKSFRLFITRTFSGHSIATFLIIILLYTCIILSCRIPDQLSQSEQFEPCSVPEYTVISCMLWLLLLAVFVRLSSAMLLIVMSVGVLIYTVQVFGLHTTIFVNYATIVRSSIPVEQQLIVALITLVALIFIQSRRNERQLRLAYRWKLQTIEKRIVGRQLHAFNQQILFNLLPQHIAFNFLTKPDPYFHSSHCIGVALLKVNGFGKYLQQNCDDKSIAMLNNIICRFDTLIDTDRYRSIDKIRSSGQSYMIAVGLLPEIGTNVYDAPATIGDQLASLANYVIAAERLIDQCNVDFNMNLGLYAGIDCGPIISGVMGIDRPQYDIYGSSVDRVHRLVDQIDPTTRSTLLVSEEVYLALRPRDFSFDHHNPIKLIVGSLTAYQLVGIKEELISHRHDDDRNIFRETSCPTLLTTAANTTIDDAIVPTTSQPLFQMLNSMHSSFSSELYSLDMYSAVPIDSDDDGNIDVQWITPEIFASQQQQQPYYSSVLQTNTPKQQQSVLNNNYSPLIASSRPPQKRRIMRRRGRRPVEQRRDSARLWWMHQQQRQQTSSPASMSSTDSDDDDIEMRAGASRLCNGCVLTNRFIGDKVQSGASFTRDELEAAADRVDKMLLELSTVDQLTSSTTETALVTTTNGDQNCASPLCRPFPVDMRSQLMHFVDSEQETSITAAAADDNVSSNGDRARRRNLHKELSSACHTEYDNAESNDENNYSDGGERRCYYVPHDDDEKRVVRAGRLRLNGSSDDMADLMQLRRVAPSSTQPHQQSSTLDYLGLDTGHEADIDSVCSSVSSSRVFFDESLRYPFPRQHQRRSKSAKSFGYENEYENIAAAPSAANGGAGAAFYRMPSELSDMDIDYFDADEDGVDPLTAMHRLTNDIRQNFGDYKLATFSDID